MLQNLPHVGCSKCVLTLLHVHVRLQLIASVICGQLDKAFCHVNLKMSKRTEHACIVC
jgi:hypothetical protein